MNPPARATAGVGAVLALTLALLCAVFALESALERAGRPDLFDTGVATIPLIATLASAATVGATLAIRRPRHPVGWLFLALAASIAASGAAEGYALLGAVARPGSLPGADAVAVLSDGSFIVWFALLVWILHLTPTGTPLSRRWQTLAVCSTTAMVLWFATSVFWPQTLDPPLDRVRSPWALGDGGAPLLAALRETLGVLSGLGLVLAGVSLLVRFRRSRGTERRQLLWLVVVVVPLPAFVGLAYYASPDHPLLLAVAMAGFMGLLPIAAGLSIARYHLYDVETILSRAVAWLLASLLLALTFAGVVVAAGRFFGERSGGSTVPVVLGTLAAVGVAAPAYRGFQEALDRRFDRRRYDALRQVQDFLQDPDPGIAVEDVLRRALHDPELAVSYWVEERDGWVSADGRAVEPLPGDVQVERLGRRVARVRDAATVDHDLATTVASAAAPELENAMLRARISLQLAEVRESRARIAAAGLDERRRLERNLHDGAQQRLLALALQLRAAEVNGSPARLRSAVSAGIDQLQTAVVELRELANGLHPALLQDAGLGPAVEDLAGRLPVRVELDGVDRRFPAEVEACAWFIACEGVTNAVKHAGAEHIVLALAATDGTLTVRVTDDGRGGADPNGNGLRGITDRCEALGGRLLVGPGEPAGTTVTGELPCAW